jgi:high affinity sulfate transporter 1
LAHHRIIVIDARTAPAAPHRPRPRGLGRWMPGLALIRHYERAWLAKDLTAGLVLTALLVPVGMGYAAAAGLPVIYGLYASIVPLLAYAVFGPSRVLVLGPDSTLAALIAATILPLAAGDPGRAAALASTLAILSGLLCILVGLSRFGFITDLLSKPIRYGYLSGIALTLLVGQCPKLLGFEVDGANLVQELVALARGVAHGRANPVAAAIGTACIALILGFKRWAPAVPGVLIAVAAATLGAWAFDLAARSGIAVVGPLPAGLPVWRIPAVTASDIAALAPSAAAIALVSFADMSVLSRVFALRAGDEVDTDQELVALGAANVAAGLFQGFAVTSSASRTPVAEAAGGKSQLTGVVGAACIALLLVAAPALLRDLPQAALGAVVITACLGLFELRAILRLRAVRRSEFAHAIVCFLGVALLGAIQGIFIAVALALMAFIWRAWRPYDAVLGRVDGLKGYHDMSRHPEARRIPGLVLFRWDAPLFFANAAVFKDHVLAAVADAPTPTRSVVVAAEPVTDVDVTAADMLTDLDAVLHAAAIELSFAEMKGPVKDQLRRYGLFTHFGEEAFARTIGQAVDRYLEAHAVEWEDWEDRRG